MEKEKNSLWYKFKISAYIIFLILIVFSVIVSCSSDEEITTQKAVPAPVQNEKLIPYEIAEENDTSYAGTRRVTVRVVIEEIETQEGIKNLTESLLGRYKQRYDDLTIFYYFDENQVDGAYTVARAEWTGQSITYDFLDPIKEGGKSLEGEGGGDQ